MRIIPLQFGRQGLFQTDFQRQCQNGNVRNSVSESVFICGAADFFLGLFLVFLSLMKQLQDGSIHILNSSVSSRVT